MFQLTNSTCFIIDFDQNKLQNLPVGVAWPLIDLIHRCRECPREDWSVSEYDLIVREDLSSQVKQTAADNKNGVAKNTSSFKTPSWSEVKSSESNDGMDDMDEEVRRVTSLG